jgi:[acyl-carrier-protein] S-malonyltransferase
MAKYEKITLVFPGQGSQYPGMGKELFENFACVRDVYAQANRILDYDLTSQCIGKPNLGKKIVQKWDLNKTVYTQPAVLTTSYACYKAMEETFQNNGIKLNVSLLAGHSLGEYTALLVSGAMSFETSLRLVRKRAEYMSELGKGYPGAGLMAIIDRNGGLNYDRIRELCRDFEVHITLNNSKRQIVVGGSKRQLGAMAKRLKREKKLATMLNVEGPFHTPIMKPAASKFKRELDKSDVSIASKPVVANVSTDAIVDPDHIRKELYRQIFQVVDWRRSMEKAVGNGGNLFIEVGPKRVLTNMLKDIAPTVSSMNIEDMGSLERAVQALTHNN